MKRKKKPEIGKLRSDSFWNRLRTEQRETLDRWLFEDNLSLTETHERGQKELGLTCSRAAVWRIFKYRSKARGAVDVADAQAAAEDLEGAGANVETLRSGNLKLILTRFQEHALQKCDIVEMTALGRLMLQSEEREIQRERMALARQRFEFNASQATLKALPLVDEMKTQDEKLEAERVEQVKQKLFGPELGEVK